MRKREGGADRARPCHETRDTAFPFFARRAIPPRSRGTRGRGKGDPLVFFDGPVRFSRFDAFGLPSSQSTDTEEQYRDSRSESFRPNDSPSSTTSGTKDDEKKSHGALDGGCGSRRFLDSEAAAEESRPALLALVLPSGDALARHVGLRRREEMPSSVLRHIDMQPPPGNIPIRSFPFEANETVRTIRFHRNGGDCASDSKRWTIPNYVGARVDMGGRSRRLPW